LNIPDYGGIKSACTTLPKHMREDWTEVAAYPDRISAEIVAGLLRGEALTVRIVGDEPIPGLPRSFIVYVPRVQLDRARSVMEHSRLTERELIEAALGTTDENKGP